MKKRDCFASLPPKADPPPADAMTPRVWIPAFAGMTKIASLSLAMTLAIISALAMTPIFAFATPPTSISLSYDLDRGSLHVEAVHPSFNLDKSYVRLMNVYVNGTQISTLDYSRQSDYNEFTDDVPLTAQAGDVIKVELFCTLGGDMSKELTVTKPGPPGSTTKD